MCTLHLFYKMFPGAPVFLLANRDEMLARPWTPPSVTPGDPAILAPRDGMAGGTWTGVNDAGLVAALANHQGTPLATGSPCSKGHLVAEALGRRSADEARAFALGVAPACKSYSLILADPRRAFVLDHTPKGTRVHELSPGPHVVTNARFGAPGDVKAARRLACMKALAEGGFPSPEAMREFLADHISAPGQKSPLCVHGEPMENFGTTSASAVAVDGDGHLVGYWFAPGPPCLFPLERVAPDAESWKRGMAAPGAGA